MTCRELLQRFKEALDRDEVDLEALRKLMYKCGESFGIEALKAVTRKVVQFAMTQAWAYYRGSIIAKRDPAAAYGRAIHFIWWLGDWCEMPSDVLAEFAAYVAETVAKCRWPAKRPFVVPAAVAAEENNCELPDSMTEALGADEHAKLESFLAQEEAMVKIAPGLEVALIRDGRYVIMVV
jgi:hypothetical protein